MPEKVHKCTIRKEKGYLYFVDTKGHVAKVKRGETNQQIVCPNNGEFSREAGWIYYVDKDGDVSRAKMKSFKEYAAVRSEAPEQMYFEKTSSFDQSITNSCQYCNKVIVGMNTTCCNDPRCLEESWIQKAIKHPGRCTPAPNEDCPKGSPQYNLAMRFKHGDLHKGKK